MDKRYIKQLDETISILGYGGMRFPKHEDDSLNFEAAEALLKKAYNMGVNYLFTTRGIRKKYLPAPSRVLTVPPICWPIK